jgi:hypothetical protein
MIVNYSKYRILLLDYRALSAVLDYIFSIFVADIRFCPSTPIKILTTSQAAMTNSVMPSTLRML